MQLEFLDSELRRVVERGHRPAAWSEADIAHALLVAQCAIAAKLRSDLRTMRLLRLRHRAGDEPGAVSAGLSAGRRLTITFKADSTEMIAVLDVAHEE